MPPLVLREKGRCGVLFLLCLLGLPVCAQPDKATLRALLGAERFAELDARVSGYQAAYRNGEISDEEAHNALVALTASDSELRPAYDRWVDQYPRSYAARLARGYFLSGLGWAARGYAYRSETPRHRFDDMRAYFRDAMADLEASLALDPKPVLSYATMIRVARGDSRFGDTRLYLAQALALDAKAYNARMSYLLGLRPEWGGSLAEMQAFVEDARRALSPQHAAKLQRVLDNSRARAELAAGERLAAGGDYAAAVKAYDAVIAQRPSPRGYAQRGYAYLRMNRHGKAIEDFDRALALDPGDECCGNTYSNRGYSHLASGSPAKGLADLTHAAEEQDDQWAAQQLAGMYAYGWHGMKVDPSRARPWCERAARNGDAWSMYCLGHVYLTGWGGGKKDSAKGLQWLQRAAERSIAGAQNDLGWVYWHGDHVPSNVAKALYWWIRAARQGDAPAQRRLVELAAWPAALLLILGLWLAVRRRVMSRR